MQTLKEIKTQSRIINVVSKDDKTGRTEIFKFTHTSHSLIRATQRGISDYKMAAAILYGEPFYKQGLIYYVLGENRIPTALQDKKSKVKNTIVIIDGNSDTILTCYRSKDPFKHIKCKSKTLGIKAQAA